MTFSVSCTQTEERIPPSHTHTSSRLHQLTNFTTSIAQTLNPQVVLTLKGKGGKGGKSPVMQLKAFSDNPSKPPDVVAVEWARAIDGAIKGEQPQQVKEVCCWLVPHVNGFFFMY